MPQPLLRLASHLYGSVALARRRWYHAHASARRRLGRPVISIGNLSVGGTGKTPLVAAIARLLVEMGERPSILSRGYGRRRAPDGVVVVSDGVSLQADVARAGDEPFMLARAVPDAAVFVCADRHLAGRLAEARFDRTVHLLDDGFQHVKLERDVDLLVVTAADLDGGSVLPLGRLREPPAAAAAAHAVFVSSAERPAEDAAVRLGVARSFRMERTIETPRALPGDETSDAAAPVMPPGPAFAFAGIANPHRFFDDLRDAGWTLAGTRTFGDHHWFSPQELAEVAGAARTAGARLVLTTEKDAVRIPSAESRIPFYRVPLRVTLDPAFSPWLKERLEMCRGTR